MEARAWCFLATNNDDPLSTKVGVFYIDGIGIVGIDGRRAHFVIQDKPERFWFSPAGSEVIALYKNIILAMTNRNRQKFSYEDLLRVATSLNKWDMEWPFSGIHVQMDCTLILEAIVGFEPDNDIMVTADGIENFVTFSQGNMIAAIMPLLKKGEEAA